MKVQGSNTFEAHYANLYGERWAALSTALRNTQNTIALIPPFYSHIPDMLDECKNPNTDIKLENLVGTSYYRKSAFPFCHEEDEFKPTDNGLINLDDIDLYDKKAILNANNLVGTVFDSVYRINIGICYACYALGPQPGERVMDMFAHGGVHSLIFASLMFPTSESVSQISGEGKSTMEIVELINRARDDMLCKADKSLLVCAEPTKSLYATSMSNLQKYLPERLLRSMNVQITCYDGMNHKLKRFGTFDRIFVRMPPHSYYATPMSWSKRNLKDDSTKALNALTTAISFLKPGGTILYVTESLDPIENELIIHTVLQSIATLRHETIDLVSDLENLRKKLSWIDEAKVPLPQVETRKYGCALMPDRTNCGPIYICKLVSNND